MNKNKNLIYKVQPNDSLKHISNLFNMSPTEFLIQNKLSPKQIFEGNLIYINKSE